MLGDIDMIENATLAGVDISELPSQTVSTSSQVLQIMTGLKEFTQSVDGMFGSQWDKLLVCGLILCICLMELCIRTRGCTGGAVCTNATGQPQGDTLAIV